MTFLDSIEKYARTARGLRPHYLNIPAYVYTYLAHVEIKHNWHNVERQSCVCTRFGKYTIFAFIYGHCKSDCINLNDVS